MNKEYVQQYAKLETSHWWFIVRQKIILQFLKKYTGNKPVSILNIGAAGGATTQWLSTLGNVVSIETEPFFIDHLREQHIDVVNASVTAMPFGDHTFDLVCAFDVIEHVGDDITAMKEMERVCKHAGIICVTVPAFMMLWGSHDVVNRHKRRYTKQSLFSLGKISTTLKNEEARYFNYLLFLPIWIARKISNLFPKNNMQSDFTRYKAPGLLNKLCGIIFATEISLLRFIHFPFGASLIAVWKKTGTNK